MTRFNVDDWLDAYRARDTDRMLAPFADNMEIVADGNTMHLADQDAMRAYAAQALASIDELELEVVEKLESPDGDHLALAVRGHVEYGDDVDVFGERIAARGKSVDVEAALFITLDAEGKIAKLRRIRDNLPLMRAFGMTPESYDTMVEAVKEHLAAE